MLNVIYRPCSAETDGAYIRPNHRPNWYSKEKCYKSLIDSIINSKDIINTFFIFFDGNLNGTFFNYIQSTFKLLSENDIKFEVFPSNFGSVLGSIKNATEFGCQFDMATYFVEDDYLHLPDSIQKMYNTVQKLHVLSGYDHVDRYTRSDDIPYTLKVIFDLSSDHHWRTSESTGHSYMVSAEFIRNYKNVLMMYEHQISDRELWRYLHRIDIPLWVPIPGLVTQVDPYLAPGIDWEFVNNTVQL